MTETKTLKILKQAILLERRANAFYKRVSEQSEDETLKSFFKFMAEEEIRHVEALSIQYTAYNKKGYFEADSFDKSSTCHIAAEVMLEEIKDKISAAGFESAAIGAAISMEERSVNVYKERATSATDPEEKNLYQWLASWEQDHLDMLLKIDRELTEKIWFDNYFWPF